MLIDLKMLKKDLAGGSLDQKKNDIPRKSRNALGIKTAAFLSIIPN